MVYRLTYFWFVRQVDVVLLGCLTAKLCTRDLVETLPALADDAMCLYLSRVMGLEDGVLFFGRSKACRACLSYGACQYGRIIPACYLRGAVASDCSGGSWLTILIVDVRAVPITPPLGHLSFLCYTVMSRLLLPAVLAYPCIESLTSYGTLYNQLVGASG